MRRIVYLATSLGGTGGIQRFTKLFVRAMDERGDPASEQIEALTLLDELEVLPSTDHVRLRGFGGRRPQFILAALRAAMRADLVIVGHANFLTLALPLAAVRAVRRTPRLVLLTYGIEAWGRWAKPRRLAAWLLDRLVAISSYTATHCTEANGLGTIPTTILPLALDAVFEGPRSGTPDASPDGRRVLLTVTRMEMHQDEYKGVDTVLQALPGVLRVHPDTRYVVVGTGSLVPDFQDLARRLGIADAVEFRGAVADAELIDLYRECAAFVLPSGGEGFGIVYLEAMVLGRAVVAAQAGAAPEVVLDGQTGLVVPFNDPPALAAALTRLLGDLSLRQRLGEAGRERVLNVFSFARFADGVRGILDAGADAGHGSEAPRRLVTR